ncbi:uncharacterized protein [Miscanthus floridulus]|uniref:uncharacterized protein n=1 Tax=Miscanthus floridulus TaxID=154761 RepID=UPI00345AC827
MEQPGQMLASQPGVGTREASSATRSRMIASSQKGSETSPRPQQRRRPCLQWLSIIGRMIYLICTGALLCSLTHCFQACICYSFQSLGAYCCQINLGMHNRM